MKLFESFAGIGAQMEAMKNLMRNDDLLKQLGFIKEKVKFVNEVFSCHNSILSLILLFSCTKKLQSSITF